MEKKTRTRPTAQEIEGSPAGIGYLGTAVITNRIQPEVMMSLRAWSSVTLLVTVMALAGCGDSPSAPNRAVTQSLSTAAGAEVSRSSTHESFPNAHATTCGREDVTMTLVVDSQQHITTHAPLHVSPPSLAGEWMLTQHAQFSADGVTISGARYIRRGTTNTTQVFAALNQGGAFTFTTVARMHNVVQGSADNDVSVLHAKWTVNSNGQTSVNLLNIESECRG